MQRKRFENELEGGLGPVVGQRRTSKSLLTYVTVRVLLFESHPLFGVPIDLHIASANAMQS